MRVSGLPAALAALLAAHISRAESLIPELSFGQSDRLSFADSPGRIPNFVLSGQPQPPQLLSNRLILTPVAPGNQRGAVWAEKALTRSAWEAEIEFRASGGERGGGNINFWLVRQGGHEVGSHSIYTVGKFDGLGLVIDTHGGSGGMVRGFLNDGSVDYAHQHSIDNLAFGHCQYSYRNLGRPTRIKLRQTHDAFKVEVDDHPCFDTTKVSLPAGYHFGITAATPDNPDSFEVFKLVVHSDSIVSSDADNAAAHQNTYGYATQQQQPSKGGTAGSPMPDEPADHFKTSTAQFEDMHNRLQVLMHQLSTITASIVELQHQGEDSHEQTTKALDALRSQLSATHPTEDLLNHVKDLGREVSAMHKNINEKFSTHHDSFEDYLNDHHASITDVMTESMPGHGKLILIFVGTQVFLAAAYVVYKRRRANSPKKYL
ncbi:legume-like lectin family protein [Hirsutella rhossiliensis]|uniref:Legume-like lectin family domain-containing protein n=1 Tax=Hirsutella rhossiliensis TaxID=111463 RepID=A0A9P8MRX7_9HYPO|nr:legume-like lectin family domain-containing protein [Hirsutella rhossiliensis]KAH0960024.1 legume-like lectin family domain-containing protein [Hirsutella rhossiliensis]